MSDSSSTAEPRPRWPSRITTSGGGGGAPTIEPLMSRDQVAAALGIEPESVRSTMRRHGAAEVRGYLRSDVTRVHQARNGTQDARVSQRRYPDCQVPPGERHEEGCDVALCVVCGTQQIQCDPAGKHGLTGDAVPPM